MKYDNARFVVEAALVAGEPRWDEMSGWWTPMHVEMRLATFPLAVLVRAPLTKSDCRHIEYSDGGTEEVAGVIARTLKEHFEGLGKMAVLAR